MKKIHKESLEITHAECHAVINLVNFCLENATMDSRELSVILELREKAEILHGQY